jgi:hypothetical protein
MSSASNRSQRPSGRFVLRISPGLHAALRAAAAEVKMSLNDYCARKLAAPVGDLASFGGAMAAVERAAEPASSTGAGTRSRSNGAGAQWSPILFTYQRPMSRPAASGPKSLWMASCSSRGG